MTNDEASKRLREACKLSEELISQAAHRNAISATQTLEAAVSLARTARKTQSGEMRAVRPDDGSITEKFQVFFKEAKSA